MYAVTRHLVLCRTSKIHIIEHSGFAACIQGRKCCRYMVSMWDKGREAWIRLLQEINTEAALESASGAVKDEL